MPLNIHICSTINPSCSHNGDSAGESILQSSAVKNRIMKHYQWLYVWFNNAVSNFQLSFTCLLTVSVVQSNLSGWCVFLCVEEVTFEVNDLMTGMQFRRNPV